MSRRQSFWERCWKDKHGKQGLIQGANPPLISWAAFTLLSKVMPDGGGKSVIEFVAFASLIVWASLEVVSGASYFRRVLGFLVLFASIYARVT